MLFKFAELNRDNLKDNYFKEYVSFKDSFLDMIVFFQIGKFFETFFEDAKILSEETGVTLGSRCVQGIGQVQQSGIVKSTLNVYIKKLLEKNYKICILEEFKDENGDTYHLHTRTYTSGTIIEDELLESSENSYILSLYYAGNNICKMSYADVSDGQYYKTKGDVRQIISEIGKISPVEILISKKQKKHFNELLSGYNVTVLDDMHFSGKNIEEVIDSYCKITQKKFQSKLDKIINYSLESYMILDENTRINLELTRTKHMLKKKGSLLWFLNHTRTPMGLRLLKKYINEPLMDIELIKQRQDSIDELINSGNCIDKLLSTLENFSDISRICAKISNCTISPRELLAIADCSQGIADLIKICNGFSSIQLKLNNTLFLELLDFIYEIKSAIKENPSKEIGQGNIIKDSYDSNLDYLKNELIMVEKKISDYELTQVKKTKLDKLKISYQASIGYYIEIPSSKEKFAPNEYIKKQKLSACSRYTTLELQELEQTVYSLNYQINKLEQELFCNLRKMLVKFVDNIRKVAKDIARVDVLVSLANCARLNNFTKPLFDQEKISIINGYHPSLIKLKNEIIKNDTTINNKQIIILTGANMSGKSTFLKYNAIICLLAQIGSFVPADSASVTLIDKIFLRQGASDDIINNNSSFMVEMNDLKYILDNASSNSLVLLDEPAKSTSASEGGAIAKAYCEYILKNISPKTIVATHNLELTNLEEKYPNLVNNYVMGGDDCDGLKINNRKIKRGVISSSLAINTAILAGLPDEIIKNAKEALV